jgi:hypothetical protein
MFGLNDTLIFWTPSKFKNQHSNNNPKISNQTARPSNVGKAANVFAAYDKVSILQSALSFGEHLFCEPTCEPKKDFQGGR